MADRDRESAPPIYSTLGTDAALADLVAVYVEEMPERIQEFRVRFDRADWPELGRLAHQLKGAAGSYGFDDVTSPAARLELAVRDGLPVERIQAALDELVSICGRLRPGAP